MELVRAAPIVSVLEHAFPRALLVDIPFRWDEGPQIHLVTPFRVRHHGKMSAVCRTDTCQSLNAAIGVHRVHLCWVTRVIHVPKAIVSIINTEETLNKSPNNKK